jgi:hypothetical protein
MPHASNVIGSKSRTLYDLDESRIGLVYGAYVMPTP